MVITTEYLIDKIRVYEKQVDVVFGSIKDGITAIVYSEELERGITELRRSTDILLDMSHDMHGVIQENHKQLSGMLSDMENDAIAAAGKLMCRLKKGES